MLLEMDPPGLETTPGAELADRTRPMDDGARQTVNGPSTGSHADGAQSVTWLIGVPFRAQGSRLVWMYYVVDGAGDDLHAVQTAMERAYSAEERRARGVAGAATEPLKIQRILRDAIGRVTLNACQS
ncbi:MULTISPECIES: hypothetical protein [Streptomyces]|uniref:hypothetical protein n=1 Tax=Streptomyces TaxID=1883 RepID=UPI0004C6CCAB|nr:MULTISPECIES: hypothetical protein [Streptomyces]MDX3322901.1 hypothetical protein [Streptomyces sp. ME03-5684b]MDX3366244.1 hypothetical protein [Streptomyces sp. ME02-6987-2C]MDX3425642.1 hypothetical protein [Streptomyces sp. ME02-6985-2c]